MSLPYHSEGFASCTAMVLGGLGAWLGQVSLGWARVLGDTHLLREKLSSRAHEFRPGHM